jgi:type II secretory pathway component HofQ
MKKLLLFFFALVIVLPGFGQQIREMEFVNQSIVDILFTLAQTTGTSIVPDDSVTGNASYYFTDTELETALDNFLTTYNLVFWERDGVYYISKVLVTYDAEKEMVTVHARDVEPRTIIERLSKEIHQTIGDSSNNSV